MAVAARSLVVGLIAGLFLAFLSQHLLLGSASQPIDSRQLVDMLRNPFQIARQVARGARAYKGSRLALSSGHQSLNSIPTPSSPAAFSTSATMASTKPFMQAVKERRTYYEINKEAPISDEKIVSIVKDAMLHIPSSFNSQSARLVVLLHGEHDTFWDHTLDVLKGIVSEEQFPETQEGIAGFKAGYGTILFFEDPAPVQELAKEFPTFAEHFPSWSEHTSAMHQFCLWVALEAEGFGANLQHYNPIIDRKVQEHWKVPLDWKLRAQLVFGGRAGPPGDKEKKPLEGHRLFVHGAKG